MCNYRPFPAFPLKYLKNFSHYFKVNRASFKKSFENTGSDRYLDFCDKIEDYFGIIDEYKLFESEFNYTNYSEDEEELDI